jgi:ubiquinone/menaquinone biosynthesis C-methylase UbiE
MYEGRMAAVYDAGRGLLPEAEDGWAETVRDRVPAGAQVVDVGAGTGRFARLFVERFGARVVAVEPAAGMRSAASRHATSDRIGWVAGRAERLPLAGDRADVVWLSCVAHYLDLDAAGRELARVARKGRGRVLVRSTFPDRFDDLEWMRWFPGAREIDEDRMPTVEQLEEAWAPHGLRLEARLPNSQVIARDLHELVARLEHRAISTLEMISDAEFEQGLAALRQQAAHEPARPSYSAMDILSFTVTRP